MFEVRPVLYIHNWFMFPSLTTSYTCAQIQTHKNTYTCKRIHSHTLMNTRTPSLNSSFKEGHRTRYFQLVFDGSNYSNIFLDFDKNETSIKGRKQLFCPKLLMIPNPSRSESPPVPEDSSEDLLCKACWVPPLPPPITYTLCTTLSPFWVLWLPIWHPFSLATP